MVAEARPDDELLGNFFDYMWEGTQGYAYIAHKIPENQYKFNQTFFQWPAQRAELVQHVLEHRTKYEIYFAPALFTAPSSRKDQVHGARVFWCEFDGQVPSSEQLTQAGVPEPSLKIMSSEPGHEHWYWKLTEFVNTIQLDKVNRSMTYMFGADTSGWDANQILRPPQTFNHKRQRPVAVTVVNNTVFSFTNFTQLPEPPPAVDAPAPETVPDVKNVIMRYSFDEKVSRLFDTGIHPNGDRSAAEMFLGHSLAEMGMTDMEMFSVLLNADQRWGKFSGRDDQTKRLMEIVVRARIKHPYNQPEHDVGTPILQPVGFVTLLRSNRVVKWAWEGFLQEQGYMLLAGPSQVGKTQLALDVAARMALGLPALDAPTRQMRICFFSLEMNEPELKEFLSRQAQSYTPEQLDVLEQQLIFHALGEPLHLNNVLAHTAVEQLIYERKLDGIIVDSMGEAMTGSLSDEQSVKSLLDWVDAVRQRLGCFVWFIHHNRKATADNKKANKMSDIYGNQYITARATTVLSLEPTTVQNTLWVNPHKTRLTINPGPFQIKRGNDLRFTRMTSGLVSEEQFNVSLKEQTGSTEGSDGAGTGPNAV
jgi:AAA domain